jgi:hypothetical protein
MDNAGTRALKRDGDDRRSGGAMGGGVAQRWRRVGQASCAIAQRKEKGNERKEVGWANIEKERPGRKWAGGTEKTRRKGKWATSCSQEKERGPTE